MRSNTTADRIGFRAAHATPLTNRTAVTVTSESVNAITIMWGAPPTRKHRQNVA
jgi:hypothetical protein